MPDNLDSNFLNKLNSKYTNVKVHDVVENGDGSISMVLSGNKDNLSLTLNNVGRPIDTLEDVDISKLRRDRKRGREAASSLVTRDVLGVDYLDLYTTPGILSASPAAVYDRSTLYYRTKDVYGSSIDLLTNFASRGFKNYIDDIDIRNFYNNWVIDTGVDALVEQLFFEIFRSGLVRTYKNVGAYKPKVNHVSTIPGAEVPKVSDDVASLTKARVEANVARCKKDSAAKKIKWSKGYLPIDYTILNPSHISIDQQSLFVKQELISIKGKAFEGLKKMLEIPQSSLTEHQKFIIKNLPAEIKQAAQDGKDLELDPYRVGAIDYRKQPYEVYPFPRGARAFESMEYKQALKEADSSTLDGITNYILVVTVGDKDIPANQTVLESVADMFNTTSKSFDVFWNHTLKVERLQPSAIGDILGQDKYKQVNDDITGAFGIIRALIDGGGSPTQAAADLAVKSLIVEIEYVRKLVTRWLYAEYRDVAEAMGFERYPQVQFDNNILKNELLFMNLVQGMIDRRIISYRTGHDLLGQNHETILSELEAEKPLVLDGTLGVIGSPYNARAVPLADKVQKTPEGIPSEGRPRNKPAKTPAPATNPKKVKVDKDTETSAGIEVPNFIKNLSAEEKDLFIEFMLKKLTSNK